MKHAQRRASKRGDIKEHITGLGVGDKHGLRSQSGNVRGDMQFGYRLFQGVEPSWLAVVEFRTHIL